MTTRKPRKAASSDTPSTESEVQTAVAEAPEVETNEVKAPPSPEPQTVAQPQEERGHQRRPR